VGGGQLSARLLNVSHPMGRSCKRSTALPDRLRPHVLVRPGRRLLPLARARLRPVLPRGHLRRRRPRRILYGGTHPGLDGPGPRLARRPRRRPHTARTPWPRVDRRRAGEAGPGWCPARWRSASSSATRATGLRTTSGTASGWRDTTCIRPAACVPARSARIPRGYPAPRDVLGRSCLVSAIRHCAYQRVPAGFIVSLVVSAGVPGGIFKALTWENTVSEGGT